MNTLTFPTTAQIAAALEALLDQAQRAYDQRDRSDKEECAFWRRQRNAFANALGDVKEGRLPLTIENGYLMPSASRPGSFHRCWREGGVWLCSCEAGDVGQFHRHTALISAIEYAIDLVEQELIGSTDDGSEGGPIVVSGGGDGLTLTRGDTVIDCRDSADVAQAIGQLVTGAQLGRRLAQARARLAA